VRRLKIDLARHAPLGLDLYMEKQIFHTGMVVSGLFSLGFLFRYSKYWSRLYLYYETKKVLRTGAIMPDFVEVMGRYLLPFVVLALVMLICSVYHYRHHYRGSKSIYLMRRLPNRWELHRRCLTLPLAAAAICLLTAFALLLLYFAIYMLATPEECLTPGQWQKIWRVLL